MARKWWQFIDWTGNEVEEWTSGRPRPCTVFRFPWLNQFRGWYLYATGGSFRTRPASQHDNPLGDFTLASGDILQGADFWNGLNPMHSYGRMNYLKGDSATIVENSVVQGMEIVESSHPEDYADFSPPKIVPGDIIHPRHVNDKLLAYLRDTRAIIDGLAGFIHPQSNIDTTGQYDGDIAVNKVGVSYNPGSSPVEGYPDWYAFRQDWNIGFGQEAHGDWSDTTGWTPYYRCYCEYIKTITFPTKPIKDGNNQPMGSSSCGYVAPYRVALLSRKLGSSCDWRKADEEAWPQAQAFNDNIDSHAPQDFPMPAGLYCHKLLPMGTTGEQMVNIQLATNASVLSVPYTRNGETYEQYLSAEWTRRVFLVCLLADSLPQNFRKGWPEGAATIVDGNQ